MGSFKYNGKSSEDLGLVIQSPPSYEFPERDVDTVHVPGRNGDLLIDNNCFKNITRTYSIAKGFRLGTNYYANSEEILKWLTSANGRYVRLEDSYDSEVYRLATFKDSGTFTNIHDGAEAISVSFECKPQRYLLTGEKETHYKGYSIDIYNNYEYTTKPKITIKNLPVGVEEDVTMLTVKNGEEITSSITFSHLPSADLIIDSEEEFVLSTNEENFAYYVGMNGKPFPTLGAGKNTLEFEKFTQLRSNLSPYTTIVADKQNVCAIRYQPYTALEEAQQYKVSVKSYDDLKAKYQESYYANAVQTHAREHAKTYTVSTFDNAVANNASGFSFTGDKESNEGTFPDWLEVVYKDNGKVDLQVPARKENPDTGEVIFKGYGFYMCSNTDKNIRYLTAGQKIASDLDQASVITVNYYEADGTSMMLTYDNLPTWLNYEVSYDANSNSPKKITYKGDQKGYYYSDGKKFLFFTTQKGGWTYIDNGESRKFAEITWNTSKKTFAYTELFKTNTSATFTYLYLDVLPQYDRIVDVIINDDGSKTENVRSEVYFSIKDGGDKTLSNITISATKEGYFAYILNDTQAHEYHDTKISIDGTIATITGTDAFEILYLEEPPTYENEDGWDSSIFDPKIVHYSGSDINPQEICFAIKKSGNYRYTDNNGVLTPWAPITIDEEAGETKILEILKSSDASYDLYYIKEIPTEYSFDRSYKLEDGRESDTPPSYIKATYYKSIDSEEEITKEDYKAMTPAERANVAVKYTTTRIGYYKWDSNNIWLRKGIGEVLLTANIKDDVTIYYMDEIPNYVDYDLKENFHMAIDQDSGGNPTQVRYIIDKPGYYKYNNASNWKYYNKKDVILIASTNSSNSVYYLESTGKLENVEIDVIPRWWSL